MEQMGLSQSARSVNEQRVELCSRFLSDGLGSGNGKAIALTHDKLTKLIFLVRRKFCVRFVGRRGDNRLYWGAVGLFSWLRKDFELHALS